MFSVVLPPVVIHDQRDRQFQNRPRVFYQVARVLSVAMTRKNTVSHFSYAPLFPGPHFLTKMLESNILYDNLFIDILSV